MADGHRPIAVELNEGQRLVGRPSMYACQARLVNVVTEDDRRVIRWHVLQVRKRLHRCRLTPDWLEVAHDLFLHCGGDGRKVARRRSRRLGYERQMSQHPRYLGG